MNPLSWFEKHNKISWTVTIILAIAIFYISSITFEGEFATGNNLYSIIYHLIAFFFLSLFLLISFIRGRPKTFFFVFAGIILIVYAIFDELHQFFVPGRYCSLFDIFFDTVGISFAILIYAVNTKLNNKNIYK